MSPLEAPAKERPNFAEPWQAEAYAMAQTLIETGRIAPADWTAAFGAALRTAADRGAEDDDETYYAALVEALANVLVTGGRLEAGSIARRVEDWRAAYLATPHGKPVVLEPR